MDDVTKKRMVAVMQGKMLISAESIIVKTKRDSETDLVLTQWLDDINSSINIHSLNPFVVDKVQSIHKINLSPYVIDVLPYDRYTVKEENDVFFTFKMKYPMQRLNEISVKNFVKVLDESTEL